MIGEGIGMYKPEQKALSLSWKVAKENSINADTAIRKRE